MTVSLPYDKDTFTTEIQFSFRTAVARAAGVDTQQVSIVNVTEKIANRRGLETSGLDVNVHISASEAESKRIIESGSLSLENLNAELGKQGVEPITKFVSEPRVVGPMTSPAPTPAPPPGQDKVVIVLSSFFGVGVLAVALNMLRGIFIRKDPLTPGHDEDDHQPPDSDFTLKLDEQDLGEIQKLRAELEHVKQSKNDSHADIPGSSDVLEAITSDLTKAETKAAMAALLRDVLAKSENLTAPVIDTSQDHFDLMISYRVKTEKEMAVRLYEKIRLNPNADLQQAQNRCAIPQYARESGDTGELGAGIARTFLDAKHIPYGSDWEQVFVKAGMRVHR